MLPSLYNPPRIRGAACFHCSVRYRHPILSLPCLLRRPVPQGALSLSPGIGRAHDHFLNSQKPSFLLKVSVITGHRPNDRRLTSYFNSLRVTLFPHPRKPWEGTGTSDAFPSGHAVVPIGLAALSNRKSCRLPVFSGLEEGAGRMWRSLVTE